MQDKLLIIDGSSLMYRAFFALPPLVNKSGLHTGAVYGFANMLMKHLQANNYDYICVTFDKSRITFRNEIYPEYKATRQPTPRELSEQFTLIQDFLATLGIYTIQMENYEADDIIGTYAQYAQHNSITTTILSGDKDLLQLLDTNVSVALTKKGLSEIKLYSPTTFGEDYAGLPPRALIDMKALMGDTSDNIPGIAGIGEKTALKLLAEYQTLENVLDNAQNIKGKMGEKIQNGRDIAIISKQLATINTEIPLDIDMEQLRLHPNKTAITDMLERLEFKNMQERMPAIFLSEEPPASMDIPKEDLLDIKTGTASELAAHLKQLQKNSVIIIEATYQGVFPQQRLLNMSVFSDNVIYDIADNIADIAQILFNQNCIKVSFDLKTFFQACKNEGITLPTMELFFDIGIASYILDATVSSDSLDKIIERYVPNITSHRLTNIYLAYQQISSQLDFSDMKSLFTDIEMPLIPVLAQMEQNGIKVDKNKLQAMSIDLSADINSLEKNIQSLAGEDFNVNSPKQLGSILFDKLKLPIIKKTKTGYSTDIEVLEKLENYHPIISELIKYRTLTKLYSTYLEGLLNVINPATEKIHTHFQQAITTTGRLSSTQPNLQNIPVRTPLGKKIREFFVPSAGYDYLMSFDYSQIELRVLAHMSRDSILIDSFNKKEDIHSRTASEVFGVPLSEVSSELRSRAKAVNFGIVYGISDYGLSQDLKITRKEAEEYINNYFERYQAVKSFIDNTVEQAKTDGFVQTLFNRQRYLPDINSSNFNRRSFAERTAVNTPIQGTAADIIKLAMLAVAKVLHENNLTTKMLLQVHDELVLEAPANEVATVQKLVSEAMQNVVKMSVSLEVSSSYETNWADCK